MENNHQMSQLSSVASLVCVGVCVYFPHSPWQQGPDVVIVL